VNFKGFCFFAPVPTPDIPHFIIIISETSPQGKALLVPISSIKNNKYYDKSCELNKNDIAVLSKPSYIRYEKATEIEVNNITVNIFSKKYQHQCKISDTVLLRIQNGAKKSNEFAPVYKKYFDLF
jgi:hypothetical protein